MIPWTLLEHWIINLKIYLYMCACIAIDFNFLCSLQNRIYILFCEESNHIVIKSIEDRLDVIIFKFSHTNPMF